MARNCMIIFIFPLIVALLSASGSAQDNAFMSTAEQWVHDEMGILYEAGLIPDYPYDWVHSGNKLTRFEIAYYIKQLLTNVSSEWQDEFEALPKVFEAIQKLISEFRKELAALGVKITDIYAISPNLEDSGIPGGDYQDLDVILSGADKTAEQQEPCYYFGQYIKDFYRKSFLFIPSTFVKEDSRNLLQGANGTINIVYHPNTNENPLFLVLKGDLPLESKEIITGYYLFPLDDKEEIIKQDPLLKPELNNSIVALLDEVNQVRPIENLWKFNGPLSLKGYRKMETYLPGGFADFNKSLKIGGFLVDTGNYAKSELLDFGLPFYNPRQSSGSMEVDLDKINRDDLQSIQINIQGNMSLNSRTSITGGLDLIYRDPKSGWEAFWPSDAKASAGIQYQFNDYWAILSYQSFVNSPLEPGTLSTTSIGVEYNKWATLWLTYQILDFDDSRVIGALTFRF